MLKRQSLDSTMAIVGKPGKNTVYSDKGSVQHDTPYLLQHMTPPQQEESKKATPPQKYKESKETTSPEPDEFAFTPEYSTDDDIFKIDSSDDESYDRDGSEQDYEFTQPPALPSRATKNPLKSTSWNEEKNYEFTQHPVIQTSRSAGSLHKSCRKDGSFSRQDQKGNFRSTDPKIFKNDGSIYEPFFSTSTSTDSEEELTCAGETLSDTDIANQDLSFNLAFDV